MVQRIPILMYHQVDELTHPKEPMRGLVVSPSRFEAHMKMLKRLGYRGLSMRELAPYWLQGKTTPKHVFGITFDDGYQNNLTNALPVLQACGFTATCYMVSGLIGKTNAWDNPAGVPGKALMNADELRKWAAAGQDVGSHTQSHADLSALPPQAQLQEIVQSKHALEAVVGTGEVRHFCYPYGRYTAQSVDLVAEAGYQTATTTARARATLADSPLELPRILVSRTTPTLMLAAKVLTGYEDRRDRRGK